MRHQDATAIIVFAKEPVPGKVKTRLAATLSPECADPAGFAAALYGVCLENLFRTLGSQPFSVQLCITPDSSPIYFERFKSDAAIFQKGADLGARMRHAFTWGFNRFGKVLLIGSDVPQLSAKTLLAANAALQSHDCVLGPAQDGGYYLIGFTKNGFCDCFQGVEWSTDKVLGQTLARLAGRKTFLLETLRDLDTAPDLEALLLSEDCPAAIAAFLHEHGCRF